MMQMLSTSPIRQRGNYCKRSTHITDLKLSTTPLTNGFRSDRRRLGPLRSQLLFQFVQIIDACFVHLFLQ